MNSSFVSHSKLAREKYVEGYYVLKNISSKYLRISQKHSSGINK